MSERDGDAEARIAMSEIRCAIERVHVPAKFGVAVLDQAFFRGDGMSWKMFCKASNDGLFAALVGLGDKVNVAFVFDFRRAGEFFAKDFPGFESGCDGDFQIILQIVRQMRLPEIKFESFSLAFASAWESSPMLRRRILTARVI